MPLPNCPYQNALTKLPLPNCPYQTRLTKLTLQNYIYKTGLTKLPLPKLLLPNCPATLRPQDDRGFICIDCTRLLIEDNSWSLYLSMSRCLNPRQLLLLDLYNSQKGHCHLLLFKHLFSLRHLAIKMANHWCKTLVTWREQLPIL